MTKPTILIIDDCESVRETIAYVLENKYRILHALNADQGLFLINLYQPDLIITDHHMPGNYTGLDLVAILRRENNAIPVIMVSAFDLEHEVQSFSKTEYFPKPFDVKKFLKTVQTSLNKTETNTRTPISTK
ncbi:response regulator [Candidatus Margulisiibacteriota bacterium]